MKLNIGQEYEVAKWQMLFGNELVSTTDLKRAGVQRQRVPNSFFTTKYLNPYTTALLSATDFHEIFYTLKPKEEREKLLKANLKDLTL